MPQMNFTKMQGLGNDYVYVNGFVERVEDPLSLARAISDRHTGIGADGLILIQPSTAAAVRMEMYNADGSRGRMCGNGIRCVAKYAFERALVTTPVFDVETDSGLKRCECRVLHSRVHDVRVDMGVPSLEAATLPAAVETDRLVNFPLRVGRTQLAVTCVSLGNPHAVIFTDALHKIDLADLGPRIETAPVFPERINAHFVRVDDRNAVTVRTWERGSGATRACGTGACAVCVAAVVTGRTDRTIRATLPGGPLDVSWESDGHVYMCGPAVEVFSGRWSPPPP
jgi:diaminopimelate epimerase